MKTSEQVRAKKFETISGIWSAIFLLAFTTALLPRAAHAQITYDILSMAITNYTGFVIAADGPTNTLLTIAKVSSWTAMCAWAIPAAPRSP